MAIATLTITMEETGGVHVSGPLDNKVLCYGLLEVAKDIVLDHEKKKEQRIVPPGPVGMSLLHGNKP